MLVSRLMPLLWRLELERAHRLALHGLRLGLVGRDASPDAPELATEALGLTFRNPIGLAAGFDKDAVAVEALGQLGFGFVETGTVTPRPQPGNPRPRLFRLNPDRAIVNRMGFNNAGLDAYVGRLRPRLKHGARDRVPVGANVGINKDSTTPESDYRALVSAVAPLVDYVVINVSSPNTPGLRNLQSGPRLASLLRSIGNHAPPLLVKIGPDLQDAELAEVVEVCVRNGVQGLVVSNTTTHRAATLQSPHAREPGGLSGRPLFATATAVLARAYGMARGRLVLIGVGGVASGDDALIKLKAGATLVQIYTSLVFEGPAIVPRIKRELAVALRREGFAHVRDAIGAEAARLAKSA